MDNTEQMAYLHALDIPLWEENKKPLTQQPDIVDTRTGNAEIGNASWETLEHTIKQCTQCELCQSRKHVVFGAGNRQTDLLIIGEAPGANEDAQGLPFVGRAGMLLTSILQAIGLQRDDIYITNILKCRPPQNRDPFPREIECCTPYLHQQIALLQPKLIVALGRIAAQFLLNTTTALGKMRGNTYAFGEHNTPLMITYHPAYLLRAPREKAKAYVDWLAIKEKLG